MPRRRLGVDPLDPLRAPGGGLDWVRKELRLSRNLLAPELQDAHGVGRLVVIGQDVPSSPLGITVLKKRIGR